MKRTFEPPTSYTKTIIFNNIRSFVPISHAISQALVGPKASEPWVTDLEESMGRFTVYLPTCAMVKSRFIGDGRPPTFNDGILIYI